MNHFSITPFDGIGPATDAEVVKLETEIGHKLPADYRDFLLNLNGGQTSQSALVVAEHPDPYRYETSIRYFYSISPDAPHYANLYESLRSKHYKLPAGYIDIADAHGNLVAIDVRDPIGPVYYFDHEMPDENDLDENDVCHYKQKHAIPLAASFSDLIERLASYEPSENGG